MAQLGLKLTQVKLPDSVKDIDEYLHGDNPLPLTELVAAFTLVEPVAEAEAEAVQDDDQQPEVVKVMPRTAIFENELNDSANAERFVQMHGHNLKFVPELGGFIHFDGTHWTQNDLTPMILAQTVGKEIQEIGQMLIKQACKKEELSWAYAVLRHGSSSLNRAGIQNMLELAKPMMTARLHELNANPMLLGTANGVIDLKSGRLLAPRRAFMMTHHSPVAYDPTATCLRWEQFISEITCGDVEYAAFLQRCVGYWITGRTDEQLLFFLHGGGCNGKSTFMSIIQQLLGEFSRQISSNVLLFNRNGNAGPNPSLTKLVDARLVVANELPEGSRMDENLVKAMTGDDVIVARAPYAKKEMEFRPSFSLVMVGNHKPEIRDTSNGMWRRMLMLPFNASFTKAQLDPMLMEKLRAEMPGILNWAIQGCQMWQEQRLKASIPARLKQDVETYRAESDMVGCFLEECTQARAGAKVPMSEVYAAYGRWAQQNGEWVMKQLALKKKLAEKGLVTTRYNNKVTVIGLTLLDSEMADMTVSARREQPELGGNYTV